jgi:hypothetical protein
LNGQRTLRQRLKYWFENTMSSGTKGMILWLAGVTVALIFVVSLVEAIARVQIDGKELSFPEALWLSMLRTMDPGTMGSDQGPFFRVASLIVTIGGVLVVSSLIGLLANGIADKVAELRRGRSPVMETGHTLILGWSPKIYAIVSELTIANENQRHASIVVLAPLDKDEMEQDISARVPDMKTTRLVCRTGVPYELIDLNIAQPARAKSVIVLNPGGIDGDAEVVKTSLALLHIFGDSGTAPVIVEIQKASVGVALEEGTQGAITVIRSADIIAKVTAQVCRQPGLSQVYQELFDFDGDEIYFQEIPELAGKTFGDALLSFDGAAILGFRFADGRIQLNPPIDTTISTGDQVIAIAEDDDKILFTGIREGFPTSAAAPPLEHLPESFLLMGWNDIAGQIIQELDPYVALGSTLAIAVDDDLIDRENLAVPQPLENIECRVLDRTLDRASLHEVVAEERFDHAVVLCYRDGLTEAQADARVLLTLLHLRSAIDEAGTDTNIVAELLDERDVDLFPQGDSGEFIVSERLTALIMAQLSENNELAPVFEDLLDEAGSELYLIPAANYLQTGRATGFADIVAAARSRGEVALGYQVTNGAGVEVVINPRKDREVTLGEADCVIVLGEEFA